MYTHMPNRLSWNVFPWNVKLIFTFSVGSVFWKVFDIRKGRYCKSCLLSGVEGDKRGGIYENNIPFLISS